MEIDKVYFTVDSDGADTLLHENFKRHVDYKNLENGDVIYVMPHRQFDRFVDLATSTSQEYGDSIEEVDDEGYPVVDKAGNGKKVDLGIAVKGEFTTDGENYFSGWYFQSQDWNGFKVPYFEYKEAREVIEWIGTDTENYSIGTLYGGKLSDKGWWYSEPGNAPADRTVVTGQKIQTTDGEKEVWAIGGFEWVWSLQEEDSDYEFSLNGLDQITADIEKLKAEGASADKIRDLELRKQGLKMLLKNKIDKAGKGSQINRVGIYTDEKLEELAKRHFPGLETLKTRKADSLDFHNVAVWQIKAALKEAGRDMLSDSELLEIAKNHLYLDTLTTRNSDGLDFSEQAVWAIEDALKEANYKGVEKLRKSGSGKAVEFYYVGVFEEEDDKLNIAVKLNSLKGKNLDKIDKLINYALKNRYTIRAITEQEYNASEYKAGDGAKIEKMEIKNQYEGKSPEQIWNAWSKLQREHFLMDHFGDNSAVISHNKPADWVDLPEGIKKAVSNHVIVGQYGKGGPIPDNKYYYLKPKALFKDSGGVTFEITGHTPTSLKARRFSEVEKNTPEIEIPYTEVLELVSDKKMVFENHPIDKIREFRLLEMEIENIKLNFHHKDSINTYQAEIEQAKSKIESLTSELTQVKSEANTLMADLGKKSAGFKDSLDAMEAIAKKEKKRYLIQDAYGVQHTTSHLKERPLKGDTVETLRGGKVIVKKVIDDDKAGKGKEVSPCADCDTKLKAFIAKFPNNAKSWAQANDEMRYLARKLREYYNEQNDLSEGDKGYIDGLPFREFKTPSEWNTKAKKQILSTWKKLSKEQKESFARNNSFLNPDND